MVLERCRAAGYINRQSSHDMLFGRQSNFGRHLKGRLKLCSKQYNLFKLGPFEQTWVSEKYVSVAAPKSIHLQPHLLATIVILQGAYCLL